ncbi:ribonuclease HIII [Priestia taiwanensis]|uniref:Ribonuclease HIII n=1 Tax=Priestia taiwanensis TaxID=1347902 RepID=A0A917AUZ8_9BACI|nr:ribonuclease HIII [Priestia taiwanensis]MBM7363504.1 ribonuclease HIII [Priestia taiwanensis]GGE76566.1 ribonuclease HIII [Priestia taiwanensis]
MEVIIVTPSIIEEMKQHYQRTIQPTVPQGGVFLAKEPGCTITAYKSGKVMFQGSSFDREVAKWKNNATSVQKKETKQKDTGNLPPNISSLAVIGSDEVGTGDYFGPMVVAAAYVPPSKFALLKELGVKDSKDLKDEQICEIAKQIIQVVPYSLLTLHNVKYNELQQKGTNQGKMKALLHNQAISHLLQKMQPEKPDAILIDQFCQPGVYFNYLKGRPTVIRERVCFSTKAEGVHLAVAAASIIARYAFVRQFDELSKQAGFPLPKGAGKQVDQAAAKLIRKNGVEALQHFTKYHFANTDKALTLSKK